jgi:hypothetical protein
VATTTTDTNGNYKFEGLAPGSYSLGFSTLVGYEITAQGQGGDTAFDSNADPVTGKTGVVVLASGDNDLTVDAGMYEPVTIGNLVWQDSNRNGIQDAGEPGLGGVTVSVYNAAGGLVTSMITGSTGAYSFAAPPGSYTVSFAPPAGYLFSLASQGSDPAIDSNPDPDTGTTSPIILTSGQINLTIDAGCYNPAALGNYVWWDIDGDGRQETGEPGIAGVDVILRNAAGQVAGITTTDANGLYSFTNLLAGTYTIEIVGSEFLPGDTLNGWNASPKHVGPPATDSDGDAILHRATVSLAAGEINNTLDFGFDIPIGYRLTKVLNTKDPVPPGTTISFTISIENNSPGWITTLPLSDIFQPSYLEYRGASPAPNIIGSTGLLTWSDLTTSFGIDLAPGATFTVIVEFVALADTTPLPNSRTFNTAQVKDAIGDPDGPSPMGPLPPVDALPRQEIGAGVRIFRPTGVAVAGFSVRVAGHDTLLAWETVSEAGITGFNVLRRANGGDERAANGELVFAEHAGQGRGAFYEYRDRGVAPGVYTYVLEVVGLDGRRQRSEPVAVTVGG